MNLPSISGMGESEIKEYERMKDDLLKRFNCNSLATIRSIAFEKLQSRPGLTMNHYFGKIKPGMEVSELELSMILDGGFNYFGGESIISPAGVFSVTVYID